MINDNQIKRMLDFDPLAEAEKITGVRHYSENENTQMLGLGIAMNHNERKQKVLDSLGDTRHGTPLEDYHRIFAAEGFEKIFELPFFSEKWGQDDKLFAFFNRAEGILLVHDTFYGKMNGGHFYYNWIPGEDKNWYNATSSGGISEVDGKRIWVGDHDVREAFRYHLRQLRKYGEFMPVWGKRGFLWILHHADTDNEDYDYETIRESRIEQFPEDVQRATRGEKTLRDIIKEGARLRYIDPSWRECFIDYDNGDLAVEEYFENPSLSFSCKDNVCSDVILTLKLKDERGKFEGKFEVTRFEEPSHDIRGQ